MPSLDTIARLRPLSTTSLEPSGDHDGHRERGHRTWSPVPSALTTWMSMPDEPTVSYAIWPTAPVGAPAAGSPSASATRTAASTIDMRIADRSYDRPVRALLGELLADDLAHRRAVRTTGDLRHHVRHHAAEVAQARPAGPGDRR